MRYTKPNVLATVNATVAIQAGTGATATGGMKRSSHNDFDGSGASFSTTSAYPADE